MREGSRDPAGREQGYQRLLLDIPVSRSAIISRITFDQALVVAHERRALVALIPRDHQVSVRPQDASELLLRRVAIEPVERRPDGHEID